MICCYYIICIRFTMATRRFALVETHFRRISSLPCAVYSVLNGQPVCNSITAMYCSHIEQTRPRDKRTMIPCVGSMAICGLLWVISSSKNCPYTSYIHFTYNLQNKYKYSYCLENELAHSRTRTLADFGNVPKNCT